MFVRFNFNKINYVQIWFWIEEKIKRNGLGTSENGPDAGFDADFGVFYINTAIL